MTNLQLRDVPEDLAVRARSALAQDHNSDLLTLDAALADVGRTVEIRLIPV